MQTSTNAKSVPMFVSSTKTSRFAKADSRATATPIQIVVTCGVLYLGWIFAKDWGSRPSRAIEKKMRGLAVLEDEEHGGRRDDGAEGHDARGPVHAEQREGLGQRLRRAADLLDRHHARQHERRRDVEDRADRERPDHADGHVLLRVPALLGGGRDGVESDVGEEDERRAGPDARQAVGRERVPVGRLDVDRADDDEEDEDDELQDDHPGVERRRFLDPDDEDPRQQQGDRRRRAG